MSLLQIGGLAPGENPGPGQVGGLQETETETSQGILSQDGTDVRQQEQWSEAAGT